MGKKAKGKSEPKRPDLFADLGLTLASKIAPTEFLDTGRPALNWIMSGSFGGGIPVGRIIEMFGHPSTGKSWLAYTFIARAQAAGYRCVLEDSEQSYSPDLGEKIGVDNARLGYREITGDTDSAEDHFAFAEKVFGSGERVFLVLDSLAALTVLHEKETDYDKADVASKAKVVKRGLRRLTSMVKASKSIYLSLNHIIHFVGSPFGALEGTPGGGGFPFHSTTRLELAFKGKIVKGGWKARNRFGKEVKTGGTVVGVKAFVLAKKSRATSPFKSAEIEILFEEGVKPQSGLLSVGLQLGVVKKAEKMYAYLGKKYQKSKLEAKLYEMIQEKGEL